MKYRHIVLAICLAVLFTEIIPVYSDTDGLAIMAVRTTAVGSLGHVGVGFQNDDGTWTIGAIENSGGSPVVLSQKGLMASIDPSPLSDNGAWIKTHMDLNDVEAKFRSLGYDGIKIIHVSNPNPNSANNVINDFSKRGYNVVTNNCLSATIDVLNAYGIKNLPLQIAHVAPNDYYANVQGEEYLWDSSKNTYTDLSTGMSLAATSSPTTNSGNQESSIEAAQVQQDTTASGTGSPQESADWSNKASDLNRQGRFDEALQASEKAIELNQSNAEAWEAKNVALLSLNRSDEALQVADKAIALNPQNAVAWSDKGVTLFVQGKDDDAIKAFDQAIQLNPNCTNYWSDKHAVLEALGRTTEADAIAAKAKIQPSAVTSPQYTNQPTPVTFTLYFHNGDLNGPVIPGVEVTGQDGSGSNFQQTTDSRGSVSISGNPGTWSFFATAFGYQTKSWSQSIFDTGDGHEYLQQVQQQDSIATTTPQGSESSVVGQWTLHWECSGCGEHADPVSYDSEIDFNNDGTFTITNTGGTNTGGWVQNGDTIRLQQNPRPETIDNYGFALWQSEGDSYEGTINGDTMSGTGSGITHWSNNGDTGDKSVSFHWSASRIGTR